MIPCPLCSHFAIGVTYHWTRNCPFRGRISPLFPGEPRPFQTATPPRWIPLWEPLLGTVQVAVVQPTPKGLGLGGLA